MTDDYKKNILSYLTGNLSKEKGDNSPQFGSIKQRTNNLYTQLADEIGNPSGGGTYIDILGELQSNSSDNSGGNITILYGNSYNSKYTGNYGWIALLDKNFDLITIITKYDSGVVIGEWSVLNVDESGNLYGIETRYGESTKRFIMLNNVALLPPNQTDYILKIRKAYSLPSSINSNIFRLIRKAPEQSKYLLGGLKKNPKSSYANYMVPDVTELVINVGSENTWNTYSVDSSFGSDNYEISDIWANWGNELDFTLTGGIVGGYANFCLYQKSNKAISYKSVSLPQSHEYTGGSLTPKIITPSNIYIGAYFQSQSTNKRYYILFRYDGSYVASIYGKEGSYADLDSSGIGLRKYDTDVFFYDIINISEGVYTCDIGRIVNNKVYYVTLNNVKLYTLSGFQTFMTTKEYNLYNFYFQAQNEVYNFNQVYNLIYYNGLPYVDVNSMVSNSGIIYDSNGEIIFARNLYNRVVNSNTTISTLQIPNTSLNNTEIARQDLISETNSTLIMTSQAITKNIYETLNINFYGTIKMRNDNNPNNQIINTIGASRLNDSISQTIDYDKAKATKLKVNYSDNTSSIIELASDQIQKVSDTSYLYDFNIYITKEIRSIQIISNDEKTTYQTIESTFGINKLYNINQFVEIE